MSIDKMNRPVLTLLLAGALAACAGAPVEQIQASLAQARSCCSSPAELAITKLPAGARQKFDLSTSLPVFKTPEGLGYVLALELPDGTSKLTVQSYKTGIHISDLTYVDPGFLLLDANKQVVGERNMLPLRKRFLELLPGVGESYYGADIDIPAGVRYVVTFANVRIGRGQQAVADNGTVGRVRPAPVGTLAFIAR